MWVPSTIVKAGVVEHICKPSAEDAEAVDPQVGWPNRNGELQTQ